MKFKRLTNFLQIIKKKQPKIIASPYQYRPPRILSHYNVQTLYSIVADRIQIEYERQRIFFIDGGHVSLDWVNKGKKEKSNPVVMIMHGTTGGSNANYIKILVKQMIQKGFTVVCLNSRGFNSAMTSPIPFIGLHFTELQASLDRIKVHFPENPLYLVGLSLGGNYLMRYLLRNGQNNISIANLRALILVSPPFDIKHVMYSMNLHYQKIFVRFYLKYLVFDHQKMKFWQDIGLVDFDHLKKAETLVEFHQRITEKIVGIPVDELFDKFKIENKQIEEFNIRSLIITSKDDPMVDFSSIPVSSIINNRKIKFLLTEKGSHLCWLQGFTGQRWYPKPIIQFIQDIQNNKSIQQI